MDADLQQVLIDRYPNLLNIDPSPWGPGMGFTIRVGAAGWFGLLDRLFLQIEKEQEGGISEDCHITSIKEKMGELHFTYEGADEQVVQLVQQARLESAQTCQVCGRHGNLRILPGSIAATLCDADARRLCEVFGEQVTP